MARLGLERTVVDAAVLERTAARLGQDGVVLPTIAQLKNPSTIPAAVRAGETRTCDRDGVIAQRHVVEQ